MDITGHKEKWEMVYTLWVEQHKKCMGSGQENVKIEKEMKLYPAFSNISKIIISSTLKKTILQTNEENII